jgi:hypothetical protein
MRRRIAAFLVLALAMTTAACRESIDPGDPEPEVATIRLTVGGNAVTIAENGAVTGGPLRISTTDQTLTAEFLRADGSPELLVTSQTHRLDLTGGTNVTFTRASAFSGAIRGSAAGTTTMQVSLFHLEENHPDFGPFPIQVETQ